MVVELDLLGMSWRAYRVVPRFYHHMYSINCLLAGSGGGVCHELDIIFVSLGMEVSSDRVLDLGAAVFQILWMTGPLVRTGLWDGCPERAAELPVGNVGLATFDK